MSESSLALARQAVERFNRDFGEEQPGPGEEVRVPEETRGLYVGEPVIVPIRAALEDIEYSGATALADFAAASREAWSWLRIDIEEMRELDDRRVLMTGTLTGVGRESGAETTTPIAATMEVEGDRIAVLRTFAGEHAAREAVGK